MLIDEERLFEKTFPKNLDLDSLFNNDLFSLKLEKQNRNLIS